MKPALTVVAVMLGSLLLGACAQGLEGISAIGFYPPELEAQRNVSDPLFGWPGRIEVFN